MAIGILSLHLTFPGCKSLKEKRSYLQPILKRLHREFNVSTAEVDLQDLWQESIISVAMINNNRVVLQRSFETIKEFMAHSWPDVYIADQQVEIL
jgi:uncharacterized protein YlxP (DUF503 family)